MGVATTTKVFLSYARIDGSEMAVRLYADLRKHGLEVWLDTRDVRGGATWTIEIEKELDKCDVALALLTRGSDVSEICRAEQIRALRHGKCVIPLRVQKDAEIPLHLEGKNYRDFSASDAYQERFDELLLDIAYRKGVELKPQYRVTRYDTVPPFPANYVERPQELWPLHEIGRAHV